MKASQRENSNQNTDEIKHRLLKNFKKNVGEVGAEDIVALNRITKEQLRMSGKNTSPGEIIDITRAVMSDSGADPTLAVEELTRKKKR